MRREAVERGYEVEEIDADAACKLCPVLRRDAVWKALLERDPLDLDVHAIHQGLLRGAKQRGTYILLSSPVTKLTKSDSTWTIETEKERFSAGAVINAAGAWGDHVARCAGVPTIGLRPLLRTAFTFDAPAGYAPNSWPFTYDIEEKLYFKLENGIVLASPMDEVETPASDVTPDYMDIAMAADRLQQMTTLEISHIRHKWAGLRTFAPDRELVIGESKQAPGFFWLAGQGGIGIMTAPAAAEVLTGLVLNRELPTRYKELGCKAELLSPERF